MNKLIYCITSVNDDILSGITAFFVGIFTTKFWRTCLLAFIFASAILCMMAWYGGMMVVGVYVAKVYFPANSDAMMWIPIGFVWASFIIFLYSRAMFLKCKEISHD